MKRRELDWLVAQVSRENRLVRRVEKRLKQKPGTLAAVLRGGGRPLHADTEDMADTVYWLVQYLHRQAARVQQRHKVMAARMLAQADRISQLALEGHGVPDDDKLLDAPGDWL